MGPFLFVPLRKRGDPVWYHCVMDAGLSGLVMALRCLISIGLVFLPAFALLPTLPTKKWFGLLGLLSFFCLAGSTVIVVLYVLGPDYYTLLEFLYLPFMTGGVALVLPFYRKKLWYTLFVFTLSLTLYLILNFPTEILRRYFPDPIWGEVLYLVIRLLWLVGLFLLFLKAFRAPMLEAEMKIGRRFLYPFLLNLLILGLLTFIGVFPKMWYKRDSSVFYLIGYAGLFIPVAYLLIYRFIRILRLESERSQAEALNALKINGLEAQIHQDEAYQKETAKTRHDLHHHIEALLGLLSEHKDEEAIAYLESYSKELKPTAPLFHSGSYALDAILSIYEKKAKEAGIRYEIDLIFPGGFPLDETETITLFANLLENAFNGAVLSKSGDPFLRLKGKEVKSFFRIEETNSSGEIHFKEGFPLRKDGNRGLGAEQIDSVFKNHDGILNFDYTEGVFKVEGALPLHP